MPTHDIKKSGQSVTGSVISARILPKGLNSEDSGQKWVRTTCSVEPYGTAACGVTIVGC